jgi:Icc-related predicted phosphoesterase
MRILALSDRVVDAIYSPQIRDMYGDVDLVVGCGDLPFSYLEYVVTMLSVPVVYVFGNHDRVQHMSDGRRVTFPEGCISLEGRTENIGGLLLAGLGGSMRYQPNVPNQYTDTDMRLRMLEMAPQLLMNKAKYGRYLDILVTHSPPLGIHDAEDLPHTGFKSLLTFMRRFKPRYLLHGHTHLYRRDTISSTPYRDTEVVNVYPNRLVEWNYDE